MNGPGAGGRMWRLAIIAAFTIPLVLGAVLVARWTVEAGGATLLRGLIGANPLFVLVAILASAICFFARFIRWQFVLRRVGVRLPIRSTLGTYIAGLWGAVTPAYVGEAVRGVLLRRRFGVPFSLSLLVLLFERLCDVAALAMIALLTAALGEGATTVWKPGLAFLGASIVGLLLLAPVGSRAGVPSKDLGVFRRVSTLGPALALSLLAWSAAAMLLWIAGRAVGIDVGMVAGARIFSSSTLLGAVTLLPAGIGVTGTLAILDLGRLGVEAASAVLVVALARLTSAGLALALGIVFLWREVRSLGRAKSATDSESIHFDEIAEQYNAQWSPHVWDLLLERKLGLMTDVLPPPASSGIGLDLGCGLGLQSSEMRRRGFHVIGLDPSVGLLRVGQGHFGRAPVLAGSALALPFADSSLDFVYTIGVLHHLPGHAAQRTALGEIRRVLKPGGVLMVHESNPRNPLFRFYMGYLFPILKSIDEGTEWWIDPRDWSAVEGLQLEGLRYFTFLPDFTPRFLVGVAVAIERMLERAPTRPYSAHYMAVLRKPDASHAGRADGGSLLAATASP